MHRFSESFESLCGRSRERPRKYFRDGSSADVHALKREIVATVKSGRHKNQGINIPLNQSLLKPFCLSKSQEFLK